MKVNRKNQREILQKLGITELNEMQLASQHTIHSSKEIILLSPTGSGKTLAFLIPLIANLDASINSIQLLIIAPSRELAIQIHQVCRELGSGYKSNVVYGGRHFSKDRVDLKTPPSILIGTPGRIADHIRRGTIEVNSISSLVLDEFDKSLEIGFEDEMQEIIGSLDSLQKKVLTSATDIETLPDFLEMDHPETVNFLLDRKPKIVLRSIISPEKDKLSTLAETLDHLGDASGIVFCNFKDSIRRVSQFLNDRNIDHGCFYGGMEQFERERSLVKFRNGTHKIIIATDLAARGLDIPEIQFILHYHLPIKEEEFIHRNGRTARMGKSGTSYVLIWEDDDLPNYMPMLTQSYLDQDIKRPPSEWKTIFISGGRKDKISKGDIAGMLLKKGNIDKADLGLIELTQDCAFAAIASNVVETLIKKTDNQRIKKKKVRIKLI